MKDLKDLLDRSLRQTDLGAIDIVDIVPLPRRADPMVRLRTLEEALQDFDREGDDEAVSYLIQFKPRRAPAKGAARAAAGTPGESMYLPDGKLNIAFLMRNAELLLESGDHALAKNVFLAVHKSGERTGPALFGIARCLELEGKLDEARKHYEEAIAYHPTLEGYRRLSTLFLKQGKEPLAAEVFERALALRDLKPETAFELHLATGNCLSRAKNYAAAEKHYGKALSIKPSSGEIHQNLGSLYLVQGRIQEARAQFQAACQANPKNDAALSGLASCAMAEGDKRAAHDLFAQALDARLDNPHAIYHLIKCAYELRSYATAARLTEEYVQVAPVNPNLMYSLAGLQYHLGRLEDAGRTLTQILSMQPTHAGAKDLLARVADQARIARPEAGLS